ncbi:MAG: glycerol-3-phosphate acyltransferase [Clostridia bacterium]|nr:glycerol-3-phosphate acyltransferase [Clostridia bacterium]MBQ3153822.1 glycerol-3-phosphate acyltransferase [Clostridia bacterium]
MKIALSILLGYLLGSLNPAALISRIKQKNIRNTGTGNLGATNVLLNFGKKYGAIVMAFDIFKAFLAVKLAEILFPAQAFAGAIAGCSAVVGHVFPFYLKFKGGKGLAAFGGFVLASSPLMFLFLLTTGTVLMFIVNYSVILPYYAGIVFPIYMGVKHGSLVLALICSVASAIILIKHAGNIKKALNGTDNPIREYAKKYFGKKKEN